MNRQKRTKMHEWLALRQEAAVMHKVHLRDLFAADPLRGTRFAIAGEGLYLDYSKNPITTRTMELLLALARGCDLKEEIARLFAAGKINETEDRPVLHWALRDLSQRPVLVDGRDIKPMIRVVRERMAAAAEKIRRGLWLGHGGQPLKHVVNIGIGGSDLGPQMACEALQFFQQRDLHIHFVSNVDGSHLSETLRPLAPENTLFIVASKTFTTQETRANADSARRWLENHFSRANVLERHFIAVTANPQAALAFGIPAANIFEFWPWVGGRFSLASAVGLPLMIAIGADRFRDMLEGFQAMDDHFRSRDFAANLPVLLGLLGVWQTDFIKAASQAVIPYDYYLRSFPAYLQQLEMESNGKRTDRAGRAIDYATAPVLWGSAGTNGQHAYFQLLHQGSRRVPCDFIGFCRSHNPLGDHHEQLLANLFAQSQALAFGKTRSELADEAVPVHLRPFREFPGNRPSNTIMAAELTPELLGKLVALYEHKVFVQGVLWNIFSFDQWGVELGKGVAQKIFPGLQTQGREAVKQDSSTQALLKYYWGCRRSQ